MSSVIQHHAVGIIASVYRPTRWLKTNLMRVILHVFKTPESFSTILSVVTYNSTSFLLNMSVTFSLLNFYEFQLSHKISYDVLLYTHRVVYKRRLFLRNLWKGLILMINTIDCDT